MTERRSTTDQRSTEQCETTLRSLIDSVSDGTCNDLIPDVLHACDSSLNILVAELAEERRVSEALRAECSAAKQRADDAERLLAAAREEARQLRKAIEVVVSLPSEYDLLTNAGVKAMHYTLSRALAAAPASPAEEPQAERPEPKGHGLGASASAEPASERCEECDGRGYHVGLICCGNLLDGDCRGDCAVPERVDCYFCGGSGEAASTAEPQAEPASEPRCICSSAWEAGMRCPSCEAASTAEPDTETRDV